MPQIAELPESKLQAGSAFQIEPFPAPAGAEVVGLDLAQPLNQSDFSRIHRAHLDHHVLVFRDQHITPQQHIDFSRRFGKLMIHVLHKFHLPGHPEIITVSNVIEDGKPIGLGKPDPVARPQRCGDPHSHSPIGSTSFMALGS